MELQNINLLGVVVSAIAAMATGFVWYGPLFGKPWMKLMGMKSTDMKMDAKAKKAYAMNFVGTILMAYVLATFVGATGSKTIASGLMIGFWSWLGFVMPVQMTEVLFGGKSWELYYINTGYQLASLLLMGAILGSIV